MWIIEWKEADTSSENNVGFFPAETTELKKERQQFFTSVWSWDGEKENHGPWIFSQHSYFIVALNPTYEKCDLYINSTPFVCPLKSSNLTYNESLYTRHHCVCSRSNFGGPKCHNLLPPPPPPPPSPPHTNTHTPTAHLVLDSHCAVVLSGRGQKRRGWGTVRGGGGGLVCVWGGHILFWGWLWDCYYHFQSIKAFSLAFSHSLSIQA